MLPVELQLVQFRHPLSYLQYVTSYAVIALPPSAGALQLRSMDPLVPPIAALSDVGVLGTLGGVEGVVGGVEGVLGGVEGVLGGVEGVLLPLTETV